MKKIILPLLLLLFVGCATNNDEYENAYTTYVGAATQAAMAHDDTYEAQDETDEGSRVLFELATGDENENEADTYEPEYIPNTTTPAATTMAIVTVTTPTQTTTYTAQSTQPETLPQYNFILNTSSMLFHTMTCDTLPLPQNRQYFVNREDAEAAALRGCLRCNP